jgi:hypothetical protein
MGATPTNGVATRVVNGKLAPPSGELFDPRKKSVHFDPTGFPLPFRYLLIDLSSVSFVDTAGTKVLKTVVHDFDRIGVTVVFAGATGQFEQIL